MTSENASSNSVSRVRYVTTAIVYPNSRIHVGWAWECLGADWLVRALKLFGEQTFFATGMDEHSLNVQRAAEKAELSPQAYCDQMAEDIRRVLHEIGIDEDRFIRTSDPDHVWVVQQLVQKAFDQGDIYPAKYEGLYCEGCEAFYTERDLVEGLCPAHKKPPKWISEENFFFKLSRYEAPLLKYFEENPDFLQPTYRREEVLNFIRAGLKDFSVSRSTFQWGVPLPFDPKHVVYVWFDALINYLTAAGLKKHLSGEPLEGEEPDFKKCWPADVHIIGKDISRFHCVYWPAMLMSLGIELPRRVFAHGYINISGARMSKSSGNVVNPDDVVKKTGADPFRYYLLAENQFGQDGNFDLPSLMLKNNADLANDWGNLVNRSISMTRKYFPDQSLQTKTTARSQAVRDLFESLPSELKNSIDTINPAEYVKICLKRSRALNLFIDQTKPWSLAKDPASEGDLREVLFALLEGIRWLATVWMPVLPFRMPAVFEQLNVKPSSAQGGALHLKWGEMSFQPNPPAPIYPRLEKVEEGKEA